MEESDKFKYDLFCFYQKLLSEQESLDPEFEKILNDNIDKLLITEEEDVK